MRNLTATPAEIKATTHRMVQYAEASLNRVEAAIGEIERAVNDLDDLANRLLDPDDLPEDEAWLSDDARYWDLIIALSDRVTKLRHALAAAGNEGAS